MFLRANSSLFFIMNFSCAIYVFVATLNGILWCLQFVSKNKFSPLPFRGEIYDFADAWMFEIAQKREIVINNFFWLIIYLFSDRDFCEKYSWNLKLLNSCLATQAWLQFSSISTNLLSRLRHGDAWVFPFQKI